MKTNEYLAGLLLDARTAAHGDLQEKLIGGLRSLDAEDLLGDRTEAQRLLAAKLKKGGRKKARTLVTEAGHLAREQFAAACTSLYALTALERHLKSDDPERIITPWEQELVTATAPLAETLRAQNDILTEPVKKKKGEEGDEMDATLPSGALARLYTAALGYDSLPRLCAELGLDLGKDEDVLALDAALAGLVSEYSLAQRRSEEVGKRAKRHAEELESQHYALIAAARPIHERAEAIRVQRRNPTIPGLNMDPPKPAEPVPPPPAPVEEPQPPTPPTAREVAAELVDEIQRRLRVQQDEGVIDAPPAPAGLLGDGEIPWFKLRIWCADTGQEVLGTVRLVLLGLYVQGHTSELSGYHFVPPERIAAGGRCEAADGATVHREDAALVDDQIIPLPAADQLDWTGYEAPEIRSEAVSRTGTEQTRRIPSHRPLTAQEIEVVDAGFPNWKVRGVRWDNLYTYYEVDAEQHAAHRAKAGLGEELETKKKRKR